LVDLENLEL